MKFKLPIVIVAVTALVFTSAINVSANTESKISQQVIKKGKIINVPIEKKERKPTQKQKNKKNIKTMHVQKGNATLNLLWTPNDMNVIKNNLLDQNIDEKQIEIGVSYKIQRGDTLSMISQTTKVPLNKLIYQNQISNKDLIFEADSLYLQK